MKIRKPESKIIKKISIVIPVLNEKANIQALIKRFKQVFINKKYSYELIFIDDHSTDGTYENLKRLSKNENIFVYKKVGKKGKSYSLLEGFEKATGDAFVMIDADLQYPVEAIPEMVEMLKKDDLIIGNRKQYHAPKLRKILSKGFRWVFGSLLFNLPTDIQSGLKVFKRSVFQDISFSPKSAWTFDLEFIHRAVQAGYTIKNYDIFFARRENGSSKVNFIRQSFEIGFNALILRLQKIRPLVILPEDDKKMLGAGIGFKKKRYITHTTLSYHKTALKTFVFHQIAFFVAFLILLFIGIFLAPIPTLQLVITGLTTVYFIDALFNFFIIIRSLKNEIDLHFTPEEIAQIDDEKLPVYSILCPLYKEAAILPQFLNALQGIDWPKEKLEVLLLLEEDDKQTISKVKKMIFPAYVKPIIVPLSQPKTKPKACNYGLNIAKGDYIVIFDAEDIPEPDQLKKAYLGFQKLSDEVICLQAKLNYYNPKQNWLTRFFTAEYSLWFDITLPGFQSINTSIPLGGTSNHFKTKALKALRGWDTFNVTEDADLGIRLFKEGYKTAIIDSLTLEEANSNPKNWMRQRSRWIKGYLQSYLVHMRDVIPFARKKGIHALYFQFIIGGKLLFIYLNPLLWIATVIYFVFYPYVASTIELLYLQPTFYIAAFSLIFGNFLFFYYYFIGLAKRKQWDLMFSALFIPIYWIMISISGWIALYQLLFKPHYWEKTIHGLHLGKAEEIVEAEKEVIIEIETPSLPKSRRILPAFFDFIASFPYSAKIYPVINKPLMTSFILAGATLSAHVINLLFTIYLFRTDTVSLETISLISLISSFLFLSSIFTSALYAVMSYKTGFLESRFGSGLSYEFWKLLRRRSFFLTSLITICWIISSPYLVRFFHAQTILPFIVFAPVLFVSFAYAYDRGYLEGKLLFAALSVIILVEPIFKFLIAFFLVLIQKTELIYTAIPLAFVMAYFAGWLIIPKKLNSAYDKKTQHHLKFPYVFLSTSLLSGFANIGFLSLDIILANHFLSAEEAGIYALLSITGKIIYFLGSLSSQFVIPFISRLEGKNINSRQTFHVILSGTVICSLLGFFAIAVFRNVTLPLLLADKAELIMPYIVDFSIGIFCFTIARAIITYYLVRRIYLFTAAIVLVTGFQIFLISLFHNNLITYVTTMAGIGIIHLLLMIFMHINSSYVKRIELSIAEAFRLLKKKTPERISKKPSILIYNWRDTKHVWAGGAEVYIHEIAKRWIAQGNNVTIFCGNDRHSLSDETIEGVQIIRRGGAYTVYVWAVVYYLLKLRGKYDVIIDCENGIPFFTPLFVEKPVFLLIHHVHQEVFRQYLSLPIAWFSAFLESKFMPFVYKNLPVITVSESSRNEIIKLGFSYPENIHIVNNGIDYKKFYLTDKTTNPSFTYLGRLKIHKNIHIAITAFAQILKIHPTAIFNIVGEGESIFPLKRLVRNLGIEKNVIFYGKVTEELKAKILAESWVMLQPSQLEGWGITVIEANAAGTPVIASNVNGLRDSVVDQETGFLVKPRSIIELAQAMDKLIIDQTLRERLSNRAVMWAKHFTWDKSADLFYELIEKEISEVKTIPAYGEVVFARSD